LTSVFPAHAPADAPFALELSRFLEVGCDALCFPSDGAIRDGQDLLTAAEAGLSSDLLVLILSPASNLHRWPLERWQSILIRQAAEVGTRVAVVLLEACEFPLLLRRSLKFFDATENRLGALRRLKRWIHSVRRDTAAAMTFSPDLEHLYSELADRTGTLTASGALAQRFAREAALDFDAVLWIPAHRKTLARIAGELGAQLAMPLEGPLEENCPRIKEVLSCTHCLLVLDGPDISLDSLLPADGRTSILFTAEPVEVTESANTVAAGRALAAAGRLAEAYEIFTGLLNAGIDTENCARELVWICENWGRIEEANSLRFHVKPVFAWQLALF
jgi:hypothetical protein